MPAADVDVVAAIQQFHDAFGVGGPPPIVVRAPGRVNLIGEHTDYNDGFVFPMAIEPHVLVVARKRNDETVRLRSTIPEFAGQVAEFALDGSIAAGEPTWANYSKGIAAMLLRDGRTLGGMDALLVNTLPMGGGLSSSAALEIGTGQALLALAGQKIDPQHLAELGQQAEHEYAGAPVGIMDQTIVACGRAGTAMLLDCRDLSKRFIPIDPDAVRVVIVNSMVKHALVDGGYAQRRAACEAAVGVLARKFPGRRITHLRDVTAADVTAVRGELVELSKQPPFHNVLACVDHVVGEIPRTTAAADLLGRGDYAAFGKLMLASHRSLSDLYRVSTPELDHLVDKAMTLPGVYGARMTGGGFGGCIVALVQPAAAAAVVAALSAPYPPTLDAGHREPDKRPDGFVTTATDGARVVA